MKKIDTGIPGLYILEPTVFEDERGWFMEAMNPVALNGLGIKVASVVQTNHSHTIAHGFRGLHFQNPPFGQAKYVRCIRGLCHDIVMDIRKGSPTYGQTAVIELSDSNRRALWVPIGFAHGFYAVEDSDLEYFVFGSGRNASAEAGLRLESLGEGLSWPPIMNARDASWPTLAEFTTPFIYKGSAS